MVATLAELEKNISTCRACALGAGRTKLVFGVGNPHADILFIGEAPGYYEDRQGEPFVGTAGQLLNRLLASIGLDRGDVYIANVLKCRPPGNRDPLPEEIDCCKPHLDEQIRLIDPRIICTLGRFAASFVLGRSVSMGAVHGRAVQQQGPAGRPLLVFPLHHPAAALHNPGTVSVLEADFRRLGEILKEAAAEEPEPALAVVQMDLF